MCGGGLSRRRQRYPRSVSGPGSWKCSCSSQAGLPSPPHVLWLPPSLSIPPLHCKGTPTPSARARPLCARAQQTCPQRAPASLCCDGPSRQAPWGLHVLSAFVGWGEGFSVIVPVLGSARACSCRPLMRLICSFIQQVHSGLLLCARYHSES